jgi:hypothetical protein
MSTALHFQLGLSRRTPRPHHRHRYLVYTAGGIQVNCIATLVVFTSSYFNAVVDAACKSSGTAARQPFHYCRRKKRMQRLLVGASVAAAPPESAVSPEYRSYNVNVPYIIIYRYLSWDGHGSDPETISFFRSLRSQISCVLCQLLPSLVSRWLLSYFLQSSTIIFSRSLQNFGARWIV